MNYLKELIPSQSQGWTKKRLGFVSGLGCLSSQTKAGQFLNLAALPFLPQSVVSVLGGLAIVFNAAFAHAMLGEHLRKREVMLMMAMTLGFKSGSGE